MDINALTNISRQPPNIIKDSFEERLNFNDEYTFSIISYDKYCQVGIILNLYVFDDDEADKVNIFEIEHQFRFDSIFDSQESLINYIHDWCYGYSVFESNRIFKEKHPDVEKICYKKDIREVVNMRILTCMVLPPTN